MCERQLEQRCQEPGACCSHVSTHLPVLVNYSSKHNSSPPGERTAAECRRLPLALLAKRTCGAAPAQQLWGALRVLSALSARVLQQLPTSFSVFPRLS